MNILDEKFAEFQRFPSEEKADCLKKDGRLFDMIISQQLNREIIDKILENVNDLIEQKLEEAEIILMGDNNRHYDKAVIYYEKAADLWVAGKYEFALSYYAKAIEKINDALS